MGMFDYLQCEMPLPDEDAYKAAGGDGVFQTKSLNRMMDDVCIKADGSVVIDRNDSDFQSSDCHMMPIDGRIVFYDYFDGQSWCWSANLDDGKVTSIDRWDKMKGCPMGMGKESGED